MNASFASRLRTRLRAWRTVSPKAHAIAAWAALVTLSIIVMTGAGVRLTGSGLGCSEWPRCSGESPLPTNSHAYIEWGNRMITTPVSIACGLALLFALMREPYRRDFVKLGALLVLGVFVQAVLGGITVLTHLNAPIVSVHFLLSMAMLSVAVLLLWRARRDSTGPLPGPAPDRQVQLAVRAVAALGAVVVFVGTLVTAAGPHSGGEGTKDNVDRLHIFGNDTFRQVIAGHARVATVFGLATIALFVFAWRRGYGRGLLLPLGAVSVMTGVTGLIGYLQYHVFAYPEDLVWVHVIAVVLLWNAISWAFLAGSGIGEKAQISDREPLVVTPESRDLVAS